jgi:hypothetical protein
MCHLPLHKLQLRTQQLQPLPLLLHADRAGVQGMCLLLLLCLWGRLQHCPYPMHLLHSLALLLQPRPLPLRLPLTLRLRCLPN